MNSDSDIYYCLSIKTRGDSVDTPRAEKSRAKVSKYIYLEVRLLRINRLACQSRAFSLWRSVFRIPGCLLRDGETNSREILSVSRKFAGKGNIWPEIAPR